MGGACSCERLKLIVDDDIGSGEVTSDARPAMTLSPCGGGVPASSRERDFMVSSVSSLQ